MVHRILMCSLLVSLLGLKSAVAQDFKQVAERRHSSGVISVLGSATNARIKISGASLPNCSSEIVANPARVVIDCVGLMLANKATINVPNNQVIKRIRFGRSGNSLRIVADLTESKSIVENTAERETMLFTISASKVPPPTAATSVTPLSLPQSAIPTKTTPSANSSPTPATATATAIKGTIVPEKAPVLMTAVPAPVLSRGETVLASFAFTKSGEPPLPTLKFTFWEKRTFELSRANPSKYVLTIKGAKVSSPIFLTASTAPDGFAPFSKVTISQDSPKESAGSLVVEIELSAAAALEVKQNGGEMIVSVLK